ncbi:MFS transporter [Spirochaetia bacterium]|nr:MFS transporter [Spirochaetia bacterium]
MALSGYLQGIKGITLPLVKNSFNISYENQGILVLMIYLVSVAASIGVGIIINRWGLRRNLFLAYLFMMITMGAFFRAGSFPFAAGLILLFQTGLSSYDLGLNSLGVKTFTVKSSLMLNLQHFFFGLGSIIAPLAAGQIASRMSGDWRFIYVFSLLPVFLFFFSVFAVPPGKTQKTGAAGLGYWQVMKQPLVLRFGIILGISGIVESATVNWGALYLQDLYGFDPEITGARFVSAFFVLFTLARLFGGFFTEKFGPFRVLLFAAAAIPAILAAGFLLGPLSLWVLPATGIVAGLLWPTMLSASMGIFKENAQRVLNNLVVISLAVNGINMFLMGLINRFIGAAWGYRSSLVISLLFLFLLARLYRTVRRKA